MVGLLGMLAAGGAMGARDASNASVRAQNELEIGNARERLREEFLNRQFDKQMEMNKETNKAIAQQADIKYQRDMQDKQAQREHEMSKTGLLNKGRLDAESERNAGANARLDRRLALEKEKINSKGAAANDDLYVTLKDGRKYLPQTQQEKDARTLVMTGKAPDFETAIDVITQRGLMSNAARDPMSFTSADTVSTAGKMVNQLYGGNSPAGGGFELNFDPKSKKLIPMGK